MLEDGVKERIVQPDKQRLVIGDELRKKADNKDGDEYIKRVEGTLVGGKGLDSTLGLGAQLEPKEALARHLHLPALKVYAGIDDGVHDVAHQVEHEPKQAPDEHGAEHNRVIAVDEGFVAQKPEPVEGEDHLNKQRAREEHPDKGRREAGNDEQHGISEHVAHEYLLLGEALGAGRGDILLVDLLEERVLGEDGQGGKPTNDVCRNREHEVPEVIGDLQVPGKRSPVVGHKPPQRKDPEETPACKEHHKQYGKEKPGDGVPDGDHGGCPHVERRVHLHGLADAQGYGHEIDDERGPHAQGDGHRELVDDELDHGFVAEEAFTEVEGEVVTHHHKEAHVQGPVESVEPLNLGTELCVKTLTATVTLRAVLALLARGHRRLLTRTSSAAHPLSGTHLSTTVACHDLFHRPPRRKLDDEEVYHHDADESGYDEKNAAYDVIQHRRLNLFFRM